MPRLLAVLALLASSVAFAQAPQLLGYQGRLLQANGTPVTGSADFVFTVFNAPSGGSSLWSEPQTLGLSDGYYSTFLGQVDGGADLEAAFASGTAWLEISVRQATSGPFETLSPRQRIGSVAWSLWSKNVKGGTVEATQVSVNGSVVIDSSGKLTSSAGAFGPVSGNAPVQVANGATAPVISLLVGSDAGTVAAGNDPRFNQVGGVSISSTAPAAGQVLQYNGTQWAPATPLGPVSGTAPVIVSNGATTPAVGVAVGTDAGTLAAGNDPRFGQLRGVNVSSTTPTAGQLLQYNGTQWAPTSLGAFSNLQVFSSGSGTFMVPAGVTKLWVEVWGGGGGGGGAGGINSGGGGGAGGYSMSLLTVTPGQMFTYSVGAAGVPASPGCSNENGGAGGTSTFGTIVATGGSGGNNQSGGSPAPGGFGMGGQLNLTGQAGAHNNGGTQVGMQGGAGTRGANWGGYGGRNGGALCNLPAAAGGPGVVLVMY